LADQQIGTERQNRFLALQSDYEIRVKEQELALTRLEAERLSLRNQLYTIIGVFLFGALFAVYIYRLRATNQATGQPFIQTRTLVLMK
jgi:hypothetical protein